MTSGGELDRRRAELTPQQRAVLQERIRGGNRQQKSTIPSVAKSTPIPLSFAQERIWLHELLVPASIVYNRPANIRLRGPLQIDLLIRILNNTISRHESLWMTVESTSGLPTLQVHPPIDIETPFIDLSKEANGRSLALELAAAEARRRFDLNQVPLVRSHLLRIADDDHLLLLTFHHFCFDAWSHSVLLRELVAAFQASADNVFQAPARPLVRYSDFAAWDRKAERIEALAEGRNYWKRELDAPPVLKLPTDYPRSAEPSEHAGHISFEFSPTLVQGIRTLAQQEETTFFATALAAYQTLLYRYSDDHDLIVGCAVAGRNLVETEELIGNFINTLPLRVKFADDDTFRQVLHRTGQTVLAGLSHQQVPLQFIVQDVLNDRDTSGSPLYQAMFIHERFPVQPRVSAGVIFEPDDSPSPATMVDLSLELMETARSVTGRMNFRLELWKHATIDRLVGHYVTLLEGIVSNADQRISELSLLSDHERQQLLVKWNDTTAEYPHEKCIHVLFQEQVNQTPEAVAVVFGEQVLTYRELNERANRLAHYLQSRGVRPDTLVGLCLNRSVELIVGILGVLKAGGAYVPLDAEYPLQRLQFMVSDSAITCLVTQSQLLDRLPVAKNHVVLLDSDEEFYVNFATTNPQSTLRADNLAYVMYTSGSTGQPKGVQVPHGGVVNLLVALAAQLDLSSDDRWLSVTTPTFDISVLELLLPLTFGACVDIVGSELVSDPVRLAAKLSANTATVMQATPATWQMLIQTGWLGDTRLKVLCGGEAMTDGLAEELSRRCGTLWNMYGPTETTIWSTSLRVANGSVQGSVGRPLANTQVYVLNTHLQPVPIGVPGELHIGGVGLARGYLNRPELTAKKFIPNCFSDDPESRLYRTGDVCCWRDDGNLEFLGRIDDQVKLRGFRIELAEIECVLSEHPSVAQSVVTLREGRTGEMQLVAWFVAAQGSHLRVSELRSHLRSRLPDYMLPAAFVPMEALPLTSNGKINRRALPALDHSRPELETGYVAPSTEIERQLASIWSELLGLETVGVHDNFFALGGHSLLATRVNSRIAAIMNVDLQLRTLFESPNIAGLAREIETKRSSGQNLRECSAQADLNACRSLFSAFPDQQLRLMERCPHASGTHPQVDKSDIEQSVASRFEEPRSDLERWLTSVWENLFDVRPLSIHDDFFSLGGNSLVALRIATQVNMRFGSRMTPSAVLSAPTIAQLSKQVSTSPGPEIFNTVTASIPDASCNGPFPLSFGQQRLWFLEQMQGELTAYNMPYSWKLQGHLDIEALRLALEEIVRRHEPLRTTFVMIDEVPKQIIRSNFRFELPVADLTLLPTDQQDAEILMLRRLDAEKAFDLTSDLMLRASILRLSENEQMLLLTMHHIASDGWSLRILWHELEVFYDAFRCGIEPVLPDLLLQYTQFAVWQRGQLQSRRIEQLLQFWRHQLHGVCPLELPTDYPRPALPTNRGDRHEFELSEGLVDQLKLLSQTEGVTLHMTLLATFQVLLSRYSRQNDIAVGVPTAGRVQAETENLIGFFVNTLVIRADLSEDPTFLDVLQRVREASLAAYDNQDLPFEELVERLQPDRFLNRTPLVQVLFQHLSFSDKDLALQDLSVSRLPSSSRRVRFDLEMQLLQREKSLRGEVIYSTDLFDHSTIARLTGHFATLLQGIVSNADQRISELPMLTERERYQLLVEWNDTAVEYPRDKCVHELFQAQVERAPDAVAVVFEGKVLTYRELNERANQLAHYLRSLGVRSQTLVGLCLERSPELIVGIIGILKAGGVYVPLDADYPRQRLEFMISDSGIKYLVTQTQLLRHLPNSSCPVVCLDREASILSDMDFSNLAVNDAPNCLACIMYTSGSTGLPKGVEIRHRSIARLVFGNNYATFGPDSVFLQLATVCFDASIFELWGSLLHGAKLVVSPVALPDDQQLEDLIRQNGVTTLWLTATLFNYVVEHHPKALSSLKEILTGGEALSVRHVYAAQAALGTGVKLINGYGPTESTTFATCYRIPAHVFPELESVPIGGPIANTQVYVLDPQLHPVPVGVPGELFIGGAGLAHGYLNRPQLTAEKFISNPFNDDPGSRLYSTGDLCRWKLDGNLEFLGRLDDQVKLRGFRIELGEIESVINQHPDVSQSAVIVRADSTGDNQLVAYCVPAAATGSLVTSLRCYLQNRLPAYMLPTTYVALEALPLTSGGKIDRRALPTPDDSPLELKNGCIAPSTPIEQRLASIWREVIGITEIGIHDNFFTLGGHSLRGVQLIGRINQQLDANLRIIDLFRMPTIAQLGEILTTPGQQPADTEFVSIIRPFTGRGTVVWVGSHMTGLLESLRPGVGVLQLAKDGMETEIFHRFDVDETVDRYASELLQVGAQGPLIIAGYSYSGLLAFALTIRLRSMRHCRVQAVLLEPSMPEMYAGPDLLSRMRLYWRRLYREGPIILYNSILVRWKRCLRAPRQLELDGGVLDGKLREKWDMCYPHYCRNIAEYQPPSPINEDIHVVAGASWLRGHLDVFQTRFSSSPKICNLGRTTHLDLPVNHKCVASWTKLINEILADT